MYKKNSLSILNSKTVTTLFCNIDFFLLFPLVSSFLVKTQKSKIITPPHRPAATIIVFLLLAIVHRWREKRAILCINNTKHLIIVVCLYFIIGWQQPFKWTMSYFGIRRG